MDSSSLQLKIKEEEKKRIKTLVCESRVNAAVELGLRGWGTVGQRPDVFCYVPSTRVSQYCFLTGDAL